MPSDTLIQQVFDWLYFFHPQEATARAVTRYVVNQVYPTQARLQNRQVGFLPRWFGRFKQIIPTREGMYQWSAFIGSEHWEKDQETGAHRLPREGAEQYDPTPDDLLARYVKTLIQHTVRRTPLRVAGALGTFLWHYSAPDIRCLLPDARDQANLAHHRATLLQTITDRFPQLGVVSGLHGARTVCIQPPSDPQRQLIKAALWTLRPWWIPHVSLHGARSDSEQIHTFICPGCRGFDCASIARSDNAQHHPFLCPRTPSPQCCNNTPPHPCGGFAEVIHQYNAGLPRGATMLDPPDDRLRIPDFRTPSGGSPGDEDPGGSEPASSGGTPLPIAARLQPPPLTPEQIDSVRADARHQRHRRRHYRRGLLHIYVDGTHRPDARPGQPFMVSSHASSVAVFGRDAEGDLLLAVFPLPDLETLQDAPVPQLSVKYRWGHVLQLGIQPVRKAPGAIPEGRLQLTPRPSLLAPVFEWIEQGWRLPVVRYACVALLAAAVGGAGVHAYYSRDLDSLLAFVLRSSRVSEAEARSAMDAALSKVVQALTQLKEAPTRQEVEIVAQQVDVRTIHVNGVTLPWPTLSPETANVTAISEGLRQFPSLRRGYHDYLAQWLELFPHVDDSLSDSNLSGAIQVFEYLRHVSPYDRDTSLRFSLGEIYKLRGKYDDNSHRQAIAVYDDMIAQGMADGDPRPWHYAGHSFFKLHEYDRALEYYEKALSLLPPNAPTSAKILYNIARAYEAKGGLSPEDYRRLVDNNMQRALDITLAADQCEGRVNARVPFTLAILYAVKQEPATALHYLERAIQQEPIYAVRAQGEPAFEETFLNPAHPLYRYSQEFLNLLEQYGPQAQRSRTEGGKEPFNPCIFWE